MAENFLKEARLRRDMTQEALAEKVGVTHTTVQRHENGKRGIRSDMIRRYADALGCRPSEITEGLGSAPQNELQKEALRLMQGMSEREQALYLNGLKASVAVKDTGEKPQPVADKKAKKK